MKAIRDRFIGVNVGFGVNIIKRVKKKNIIVLIYIFLIDFLSLFFIVKF